MCAASSTTFPFLKSASNGPIELSWQSGRSSLVMYLSVLHAQNRIAVLSTPGVLRVLGDQESDLVSDEELTKIRHGLEIGMPLRPHPGVALGTQVRVCSGVFAGVEGRVTELRRQCKVIVTLAAVRQFFSLEVGIDDLFVLKQPASEPRLHAVPACGY